MSLLSICVFPSCPGTVGEFLLRSSCSELQMFALALNIKCWFKSLFVHFSFFFFYWRISFKHCTQGLNQLRQTHRPLWCVYCGNSNLKKLWYSPEVNSYAHAAVATDWCDGRKRCSSLFLFLFICLCSPPLPFFFPPYSSLIYLSSLLTVPPLTSVLPSSLPPTSADNKYHVTRMAMLLHGTLHVY